MSKISYEQFQKNYQFSGNLSHGSFGTVSKILQVNTKENYAVKKINFRNPQKKSQVMNEIALMKRYKQLPIIKIHQYYIAEIKQLIGKSTQVGIVMDLADGSLHDVIKSCRDQVDKIQILIQLVIIFNELQKNNIAHRDIKPKNILYKKINGQYKWLVADFGLSLEIQYRLTGKSAGTKQYMSPMQLWKINNPQKKQPSDYFKDDIYSLGITLIELLTGNPKYNTKISESLHKTQGINEDYLNIVESMLIEDQDKRASLDQVLQKLRMKFPEYFNRVDVKTFCTEFNPQQQLTQLINRNNLNYLNSPQSITQIINESSIQSILIIGCYIMCGTKNGKIIFMELTNINNIIKAQKILTINEAHPISVAKIKFDSSYNIWSAGMNQICKWNLPVLLKYLSIPRSDCQQQESNNLPEALVERISINGNKNGICDIQVMNQSLYAVGFNDGYIYMKRNNQKLYKQLHNNTITGMKLCEGRLYTCGLDGLVNVIDANSFAIHQQPVQINCQIVSMQIYENKSLCILSGSGYLYTLSVNLQPLAYKKYKQDSYKKFRINNNQVHTLNQQGLLQVDQNPICNLNLGLTGCMEVQTFNRFEQPSTTDIDTRMQDENQYAHNKDIKIIVVGGSIGAIGVILI